MFQNTLDPNPKSAVQKQPWGPDNPHPFSQSQTELIWPGKYDVYGNRQETPFPQGTIQLHPLEKTAASTSQSPHLETPKNRLILGDNKLVMAGLLPDFKEKIKLIYCDPPYDVGTDFTVNIPIGPEKSAPNASKLQVFAYQDRWGEGSSAYLEMMSQRLRLMHSLLTPDGSIYLHIDWRVSGVMRLLLDEIFGKENFLNEIIWCFSQGAKSKKMFGRKHNTILFYAKSAGKHCFNADAVKIEMKSGKTSFGGRLETDSEGRKYRLVYGSKDAQGKTRYYKYYLDAGKTPEDYWTDINSLQSGSEERVNYATQKPEALLSRIIQASSNPGDWVADFFCGSGTTLAMAEKLGRRWIGVDTGRFAIQTCRKRLLQIPQTSPSLPAFDIYGLGLQESQYWLEKTLENNSILYHQMILKAYAATPIAPSQAKVFQGQKGKAACYVHPCDTPLRKLDLEPLVRACLHPEYAEIHLLAWQFEPSIDATAMALENRYSVKIRLIPIPREVLQNNPTPSLCFFESGKLDAECIFEEKTLTVRLKSFLLVPLEVPSKQRHLFEKSTLDNGFNWLDGWAIDFDYHPNKPFHTHWQTFRSRKKRHLQTEIQYPEDVLPSPTALVGIKTVDLFGQETLTLLSPHKC